MKEFFLHENQSHSAALTDGGKLHTCQKSHLTTILVGDTIITDGAKLVKSLPPWSSKTFEEYVMLDPSYDTSILDQVQENRHSV